MRVLSISVAALLKNWASWNRVLTILPPCFRSIPITSMPHMPVEHVKTKGETLLKLLKTIIWRSKKIKRGPYPRMGVAKSESEIWTTSWKEDPQGWTANKTLLKRITLISLMALEKLLKSSTRSTIHSKDRTYLRVPRRIRQRSSILLDTPYLTVPQLSSIMLARSWWVESFQTATINISLCLVQVERCNWIVRIRWPMDLLKDKIKTILIMMASITWSVITMTPSTLASILGDLTTHLRVSLNQDNIPMEASHHN